MIKIRYPKNIGKIGTNRQGRIILSNMEGESFVVHETVAFIWEQSNGQKAIQDICKLLVSELEIPEDEKHFEEDNVLLALRSLEKKKLIEFR